MTDKKKVLLVEDNADVLYVSMTLLEYLGYEAYSAENGREALAKFPKINPDLALIDINLPDIDGFDLADRLKAESQCTCNFVALSGKHLSTVDIENSSFDGHQLKPVNLEVLRSVVEKYS